MRCAELKQKYKLIFKAAWIAIKETWFPNAQDTFQQNKKVKPKMDYEKYAMLVNDLGQPRKKYDRIMVSKSYDKIQYPSGYCVNIYYYDPYADFLSILTPDDSVDLTELKDTVFNNPNVRRVAKQIPDELKFR